MMLNNIAKAAGLRLYCSIVWLAEFEGILMLGLFGKKSDHPLADIKSAQALLEGLPKNDAMKALQELTAWIESAREQTEFRLDHQFAVLRLLDEAARPFERKLTRDYYAATALSPFQENRLWMVLNEFFAQVLQAYLNVLLRYRNGDKGAASITPLLPLLGARGISAATGRLKSAAVRYALIDQAIWASLAEFYAHAETQQYLDQQVALYAGSAVKTSVRNEFAAVLIWHSSSSGALSRLHMHLAERLSAHLSRCFTVAAKREPNSRFFFDLQHPMSPMRLNAEITPQPGLRFLGVDNLQAQIDALLKTLEKNIVPDEINLGGSYEAEAVRAAALHLAECLTASPPARRNVRHNIKASLSVANGFSGLIEKTSIGLDFGIDNDLTWQVEDISASGLRCVLPASGTDGVEIGSLVGIKPEKQERWGVGIVRRIIRDPQNNRHVGIEMLANQVTGVGLRERDADGERPALWLASPGGDVREVDLLMDPDTFTGSRSLHVQLDGKSYLLIPLELVEKGEDYDRARYRKIEQDTDSDEGH